jgi:hypothetical protein
MPDHQINPEGTNDAKKRKDRSPSYPAIGLRQAIEFAQSLWENERHHRVLVSTAAASMGFAATSSKGISVVAALKKYGLLSEEGSGDRRSVQLTEFARNLINPNAIDRIQLLRQAALKPTIYADLWEKYGPHLPSDATIKAYLEYEKKFNPLAVNSLIEQFRDTIAFARLSEDDKILTSETRTSADEEHLFPASSASPAGSEHLMTTSMPVSHPVQQSSSAEQAAIRNTRPMRQLRMDLDSGPVILNYPMTEEDFDLLIKTLEVWRPKLVRASSTSDE